MMYQKASMFCKMCLIRAFIPIMLSLLAGSAGLLIPQHALAETATGLEMDQVCRNWLTQVVYAQGDWAGSAAPAIMAVDEIFSGDTLLARYYAISPNGFIVVPVLKEMTPIKAYSDKSVLDEKQAGGFLSLLRDMLSRRMGLYVSAYGSPEAVQPAAGEAVFGRGQKSAWQRLTLPSADFATELSAGSIRGIDEAGPLLSSSWHQRAPYNNLCPMGDGGRTVVGCVATATAQILNYWQWPASGVGQYSYYWDGDQSCDGDVGGGTLTADFSNAYDWAGMIDSCDLGCSPADSAALAELNSEVGIAFNMNYGACGSGANTSDALTVFPVFFKYKMDITKEMRADNSLEGWFALIQEEINNSRPIQYRIYKHSIVCDGWREQSGQYEFHMNYGWGGSFTAWFVLDSLYCYWVLPDSVCPAAEEYMITHIKPQTEPDMRFVGHTLADIVGDGDGHADVGESSTLSVTVKNFGWDAENAEGVLSCDDPNVIITTAGAVFEAMIPWGETGVSQTPFAFMVSPSCPDPHIAVFELAISSAGGYATTDTFLVHIGDTAGFADDCESGSGYWIHEPVTLTYFDEWHVSDFRAADGSSSWKAGGVGPDYYADNSDGGLVTPPFLLPWQARLRFQQWLDVEEDVEEGMAWDGGIVMISSGDGDWTQIEPTGGYPYSIVDNPASPFEPGTPCFSGTHDWSEVEFDLSAYSGAVQLMFRFGTDGAVTQEGWYVDDIEVFGYICGDVNEDGAVNVGDAVFLINHVFKGGDPPDPQAVGDVNCDEAINVGDAVYLINYVFKNGDPPCAACP